MKKKVSVSKGTFGLRLRASKTRSLTNNCRNDRGIQLLFRTLANKKTLCALRIVRFDHELALQLLKLYLN